jgi:hypothetical protein
MANKEEERRSFSIPDVGRVDARGIGSIYGVPQKNKEPDYIPYNKRGRDFMGRLFFNSGVFWLGGFTAGSFYGLREGFSKAVNSSIAVKRNSVMNAVSRRGSTAGNVLGVIGKTP